MHCQKLWLWLSGVWVQFNLLWQSQLGHFASPGPVLVLREQHGGEQTRGRAGSGSGQRHGHTWVMMWTFIGMSVAGVRASTQHFFCFMFFFFSFQESGWLLFPTRSTRRSGDSVEPWQTLQPLTSCLCLRVHKTSCYGNTSPLRVQQLKANSLRRSIRKHIFTIIPGISTEK